MTRKEFIDFIKENEINITPVKSNKAPFLPNWNKLSFAENWNNAQKNLYNYLNNRVNEYFFGFNIVFPLIINGKQIIALDIDCKSENDALNNQIIQEITDYCKQADYCYELSLSKKGIHIYFEYNNENWINLERNKIFLERNEKYFPINQELLSQLNTNNFLNNKNKKINLRTEVFINKFSILWINANLNKIKKVDDNFWNVIFKYFNRTDQIQTLQKTSNNTLERAKKYDNFLNYEVLWENVNETWKHIEKHQNIEYFNNLLNYQQDWKFNFQELQSLYIPYYLFGKEQLFIKIVEKIRPQDLGQWNNYKNNLDGIEKITLSKTFLPFFDNAKIEMLKIFGNTSKYNQNLHTINDITLNEWLSSLETNVRTFKSPFASLKDHLEWICGEVYGIVANTGVGKSTFAIHLAKNFIKESDVFYCSLEMNKSQIENTLLSSYFYNQKNHYIEKHNLTKRQNIFNKLEFLKRKKYINGFWSDFDHKDKKCLLDIFNDFQTSICGDYNFTICDKPNIEIETLQQLINDEFNPTNGYNVVVIDNFHDLSTFKEFKSTTDKFNYVIKILKDIATTHKMCVVFLLHTAKKYASIEKDKNPQKNKLTIDDIRDSARIQQICSSIISLNRSHETNPYGEKTLILDILKNRNGDIKENIILKTKLDYGIISEEKVNNIIDKFK